MNIKLFIYLFICSLNEPPLMTGCFEPNLKLRQAERLFEDHLIGPESIANIGGQYVLPVWSLTFTHFVLV